MNLNFFSLPGCRKTGHKKKVSSAVHFPEVLDMEPFVHDPDQGNLTYDLTAVLIHRGPSAYSGHYVGQFC